MSGEIVSFPKRRGAEGAFLLALSLCLTLLTGKYLGYSLIGWALLACLYGRDVKYAVYSIFFFSAFFHPSGFLPDFFFSIKHFHIAFALMFAVHLSQGKIIPAFQQGLRRSTSLYPILAMLAIAGLAGLHDEKALRVVANFSFTFLAFIYLSGLLSKDRHLLRGGLFLFLVGIALQITAGIYGLLSQSPVLGISLLHHNHLAIFAAFSTLYGLAFVLSSKGMLVRWLSLGLTGMLGVGIVLTCSRTAIASSFLVGLLFLSLLYTIPPRDSVKKIYFRRLGIAAAVLISLAFFSMIQLEIAPYFYDRLKSIPALLHGYYWHYALQDHQNFGFFGKFRMTQFLQIGEILKNHFVFGVGFTNPVVGFHCLYLTILGGTGVVGLFLFVYFCRNVFQALSRAMGQCQNPRDLIFLISAFCAFVTFLFCSFMETLFLQFSIWLNVFACLFFASRSKTDSLIDVAFREKRGKGF